MCNDVQKQSSGEKIGAKKYLCVYRDVKEENCMYIVGG